MPIDLYEPRTLYGVVQRMAPVSTFLRDTFFKNVVTFNSRTVEFDIKKGNRAMAPFVHPKIGGKVVTGSGYQTREYTPPMVVPDKVSTAETYMTRLAGENPYSGMSPAARAAQALREEYQELEEMITRREEWMAAKTLFDGQIPVVGEGLNEVIDFGFTNNVTLNSDKWSNANVEILDMIEQWHQRVRKNGFVSPNICIMGQDVASALVNNKQVQAKLDVDHYDLATIAPKQLKNGVVWLGRYGKLNLDFYQYDEWYLDDWTDPEAPETKPYVPEGKLMIASTDAAYSRLYGAHTYVDKATEQWNTVEGARVPDSWVEKRPDRRMISLASHPLTVPHEVDSWLVAEVL